MEENNKKMNEQELTEAAGGESTSEYTWMTTHDVVVGPDSYLTIRYAPNGDINYSVGGWGNGERVLAHPTNVVWAGGAPWRRCYRNGFFGWVNDNYLW